MKVGEYCNREVVIVDRDTGIFEAARLMRKHHVGDVVVIDERPGGRMPVGILTDRDIVVELLAEEVDPGKVSVGDVMSYELQMAREEDDLFTTFQHMRARGIRRLPVIDAHGTLTGLLTLDDMLELISEQMSLVVGLVGAEQRNERILRH